MELKENSLRRVQELKENKSLKLAVNSMFAASVSNIAAFAVTHPLDTIKIRMQMADKTISMRQCAYEALTKEGVHGLYKGISQPVMSSVPICMVAFGFTEMMRNHLHQRDPNLNRVKRNMISGGFAGFCTLFVSMPFELLKARAQIQREGKISYNGEVRRVLRSEGVQGLYRGFWTTAWRDVPAWAVFFTTFDYLKRAYVSDNSTK